MIRPLLRLVITCCAAAAVLPAAAAGATKHGDLEFPADEHAHPAAWDYWWGVADVTTEAGNRYTVGLNYASFDGHTVSGHQVFARQGPYANRSILTPDGPTEWGHPEGQETGRFVRKASYHVPGVSEKLRVETFDTADGMKRINSWERTSLERETYRMRIDNHDAEVHPEGKRIRLGVDLVADMKSPPLLAGGTGRWWYGIPQTYGYPSRSFQYMQAARRLTGTIELEQPDGSVVRERIVPEKSGLEMVHEYDAHPEDIPGGLALAEGTQLHPRYASNYHGGMPWELIFLDLDNGAQLMLSVLAFHETEKGTVTPIVGGDQPTYGILATLRLPDGRSVPLDNAVRVEHLSYRTIVGRVPTFMVAVTGIWKQSWDYRVTYPGGTVKTPDGRSVEVPPFDLGATPQVDQSVPQADAEGNREAQRVPFDAAGSYGGCPVRGFGWSELIINWYDKEEQDPWWTGGDLPPVPSRCGDATPAPPGGPQGALTPTFETEPPQLTTEACSVANPGTSTCSYVAKVRGGVGGYGDEPGAWTVRITRPGLAEPIVIKGLGDRELYACGTVKPGDRVEVVAEPGANAYAGNPGICF
jgi:hypothetical protein